MNLPKLLLVTLVALIFVVNDASGYCQCGYRHDIDTSVSAAKAVERDLFVHGSFAHGVTDHGIVENLSLEHGTTTYLIMPV